MPALRKSNLDASRALTELSKRGRVTGSRSAKLSVRVDPGVLEAAAERLGLQASDVSEVINAALAITAAPDRFKAWLADPQPLPDDFELAV